MRLEILFEDRFNKCSRRERSLKDRVQPYFQIKEKMSPGWTTANLCRILLILRRNSQLTTILKLGSKINDSNGILFDVVSRGGHGPGLRDSVLRKN